MDTQPGHCWRCGKKLRQARLGCDHCNGPPAYCSRPCKKQDKARHEAVECKMYGPKTCTLCGKTGDKKECSQCNLAWYCNKKCQTQDWPAHKQLCKTQKEETVSLASVRNELNTVRVKIRGDFPYYIGNMPAIDFLQLNNNEWRDGNGQTENDQRRDYHILSVGCGNLRNTVLTAASLPESYQGCLHITLNDRDPFVMARNVLLLYMLAQLHDGQDIGSKVATIWCSLRLPAEHFSLVTVSLDKLLAADGATGLNEVTRGLVSLVAGHLVPLRRVWSSWRSMECRQGQRASINLGQQRKEKLSANPNIDGYLSNYITRLPNAEQPKMREWWDHALFLPTEPQKNTSVPFDNPTLTGQKGLGWDALVYSVNDDAMPFTEWDSLRVRQAMAGTPYPSPMVMYHAYLTSNLLKVRQLILQGRLHIAIAPTDFKLLPECHRSLKLPLYDRIFTSNLADYRGIPVLLHTFKPFLNANNPCSVLITEFMNWRQFTPKSDISEDNFLQDLSSNIPVYMAFKKDVHRLFPEGVNNLREYLDNTAAFLQYLRADLMAGGQGVPQLQRLPDITQVQNYHGMRMRDFRKELNRLVPFKYRVNARPLTLVNGMERAVEWCLPPHTDN